MAKENKSSRRNFLNSTALISGGLLGVSLYSCEEQKDKDSDEQSLVFTVKFLLNGEKI